MIIFLASSSFMNRRYASKLIGKVYKASTSLFILDDLKDFKENLEIEMGARLSKSTINGEVNLQIP